MFFSRGKKSIDYSKKKICVKGKFFFEREMKINVLFFFFVSLIKYRIVDII